jgi:hypothetical protein
MTRETEALFQQVLTEQLRKLRYEREERARERLDRELDEIDRKRWGYPPLRSRRWRRR